MLEATNNKKIDWNRLCLSQWSKKAACTKPVLLELEEMERDPALCHGTRHILTMEAFPYAMAQALYHNEFYTNSTRANLCHKVSVQGREIVRCRTLFIPLRLLSVRRFLLTSWLEKTLFLRNVVSAAVELSP